jgi:hypothetical protein
MKMDVDHLAFIHANPGKAFCLGCLRRLSPRTSPADATMLVGKAHSEGPGTCSSCGTGATVYIVGPRAAA